MYFSVDGYGDIHRHETADEARAAAVEHLSTKKSIGPDNEKRRKTSLKIGFGRTLATGEETKPRDAAELNLAILTFHETDRLFDYGIVDLDSGDSPKNKPATLDDPLWLSLDLCISEIESFDKPVYFFMRHSVGLFDSPYLTDFNELTLEAGWDYILHFDFKLMSLLLPNGTFASYRRGRAEGDSDGANHFLGGLKAWREKREHELRLRQATPISPSAGATVSDQ